jgi:hypothetical protein
VIKESNGPNHMMITSRCVNIIYCPYISHTHNRLICEWSSIYSPQISSWSIIHKTHPLSFDKIYSLQSNAYKALLIITVYKIVIVMKSIFQYDSNSINYVLYNPYIVVQFVQSKFTLKCEFASFI